MDSFGSQGAGRAQALRWARSAGEGNAFRLDQGKLSAFQFCVLIIWIEVRVMGNDGLRTTKSRFKKENNPE